VPRTQVLINQRDHAVLAMLAQHRVVATPQLAALLGVTEETASRRLRALSAEGLVVHRHVFSGLPAATLITRKGLGAVESPLPAPRLDLAGYRHDIGVGWLWLAAQHGTFGALQGCVSEREMRSHDGKMRHADPTVAATPYGVGPLGIGRDGSAERHYPDLMLRTATGKSVAVELELTPKSHHRLATIMRAYAGDSSIDAVLYLVPNARMVQHIQDAARDAHISDLVRVQRLDANAIHGAPPPSPTATRSVAAATRAAAPRRNQDIETSR
jgi:hypothetical protein